MSRPSIFRSLVVCAALLLGLSAWQTPVFAQADAVSRGQAAVQPPQVLIDLGLLTPIEGERAERAKLAWAEIVASVEPAPWPEVQNPEPAGALPNEAAELMKQSAAASKDGKAFGAVQLLQQAEARAPGHPAVMRALGLAYAQSGNLTRAAQCLAGIVASRRDDVDILLLLARHAAQRGSLSAALTYSQALEQAQAVVVADVYRVAVLSKLGYTTAASERLARVLTAIDAIEIDKLGEKADVPSLLRRERIVLKEMTPYLRLQQGDLLLRLGDMMRAAEIYESVELEDATARHALVARQLYLALRAGKETAATDRAIALLRGPDASAEDAQLVGYLQDQGVSAAVLAERIEAMLQDTGVTLPRLIALAKVADKQRLLSPINRWLSDAPATPERLAQSVALIRFEDGKPADAIALTELLKLVADLMQQSPEQASVYAHSAIEELDAPVTLLRAIRSDAFTAQPSDAQRLLAAVAYEQTGRLRDALAAYEPLREADEALSQQVLLPMARLYLALGQGEQAHALLGEPALDAGWTEFELALRAMAAAGQARQAVVLVDQRIKARGKQLPMDVLRIKLIAQMGQPQEACNLLLRLISSQPGDASLYRLGIDLAYVYRTGFNRMTDADRMRRAFLTRLISNLPDAVLSRISMAQSIMDNPSRVGEAEQLLLKALEQEPENVGVLLMLVELYDDRGDEASAKAMFDRYAQSIGPGVTRAMTIAERAISLDQKKRAAQVLDEVLQLDQEGVLPGPALLGDDASSLLHYLEAADDKRDSEALYLSMVRRFPDHAGLNNALGYRWVVQDKNLRQAKAMIERALKANPTNHSILDSLAWVQYKLGDFDEAQATQSRALMMLEALLARLRDPQFGLVEDEAAQYAATTAILHDHMGDILYKLGQPRKALDHWRVAAKQVYTEEEKLFDPELRTLDTRLKAKIDAMADDQPAPVAEVPGPEAHGPDGHPSEIKPDE